MANSDKNSSSTEVPANRPRLAEKFQQLKNGIKMRTYTEHTEDKGADTTVTEAEQGGDIIGRFVQKDGHTIESQGSDDAQQSGDFDKMAKKVGAKDAIVHTKVEQVSEIAHDNQAPSVKTDNQKAESVKKPNDKHLMDNEQESTKEKFINNSKPKEPSKMEKSGVHYQSGPQSNTYARGGVPQMPKMQKNGWSHEEKLGVEVKNPSMSPKKPRWKELMEARKKSTMQQRGVFTNIHGHDIVPPGKDRATKSDCQTLNKKWKVFMDSMRGFDDPLRKEPLIKDVVKIKDKNKAPTTVPAEKPAPALSEHGKAFWDVLGRKKKKPSSSLSTESKIRAALNSQEETNPYATDRSGHLSSKNSIDADPKYDSALRSQKTGETMVKPAPFKPAPTNSTGVPNIKLAMVNQNPKQSKKRPANLRVIKSLKLMIEVLRKGDVIDFKKKTPNAKDFGPESGGVANKMKAISDAAKRFNQRFNAAGGRTNQLNPRVDEEGIPHKYWEAMRQQNAKKKKEKELNQRKEDAKKISLPEQKPQVEVQPHPPEVIDVDPKIISDMKARLGDKTEKSSVAQAAHSPTQSASKNPTIKNAVETTLAGKKQLGRSEGLVKDKNPSFDHKIAPQHLPSAEGGLEEHLANLERALKDNVSKLMAAQDKSKYSPDMPREERERSMKMAERTHKYLTQGIHLTKIAIASRDSGSPNWKDLIGTGNPKVNQMGILTFANTLPGHNCPARGGCGDGSCYGMNGQQAMGGALELRARNAGLIHRADFAEGAIHALANAPKHLIVTTGEDMFNEIKDHPRFKQILMNEPVHTDNGVRFKVKTGDIVRFHDTGDILNEKHLNDIVKIAQAFPEKKFYAYTKSLHLPLEKLRALPNFNVIQSLGGKHNDKIDLSKPHAKFFPSLEHAHAAGYTPVWWHDYDAASGVNNLALVPHGSRQKEVNVDEFNQGAGEAKPETIKKSGDLHQEPAWMTFDQPDSLAQSSAMGAKGKMRAMMMLSHKHEDGVNKSMGCKHPEAFTTGALNKGDVVNIFKKKLKPNLDANREQLTEQRLKEPRQTNLDELQMAARNMDHGATFGHGVSEAAHDQQYLKNRGKPK